MLKELDALARQLRCYSEFDVPLSQHTSFHIGGNADLMVIPSSPQALAQLLVYCKTSKIPVFIMGKGTNLLISDKGIRGVVLQIQQGFHNLTLQEDGVTIRCGAGVPLKTLCRFAWENALQGLEFAYGIPGSVGGAVYMNAGAYDGEMKDVLTRCFHVTPEGEPGSFEGDALDLSYRHSAYSGKEYVITEVELRLTQGDRERIREKMAELMRRRVTKQPLEFPSAGSIFKRPPGYYAAALIEQCGLKGYRVGDAQVSEKHAGFIVNRGNAACAQVVELIEQVRWTVAEQTGVWLETEVKVVGEQ